MTSSSSRCTHRAQMRSDCRAAASHEAACRACGGRKRYSGVLWNGSDCRASHEGVRRASPRCSAPLSAHCPVHAHIVVHAVHTHVVRIRGHRRGRSLRRAHLRLLMKQRLGKRSLREQTVPTVAEVRSTPEPHGRGRIPRTHDGLVLCFDQFTLSGKRLVNASSNSAAVPYALPGRAPPRHHRYHIPSSRRGRSLPQWPCPSARSRDRMQRAGACRTHPLSSVAPRSAPAKMRVQAASIEPAPAAFMSAVSLHTVGCWIGQRVARCITASLPAVVLVIDVGAAGDEQLEHGCVIVSRRKTEHGSSATHSRLLDRAARCHCIQPTALPVAVLEVDVGAAGDQHLDSARLRVEHRARECIPPATDNMKCGMRHTRLHTICARLPRSRPQ